MLSISFCHWTPRCSSSSQTLDAVLQSPEVLFPSGDGTTPSFHKSVSDDSCSPICTTQLVSSPTSDTRRTHHRLRGYLFDSTESTVPLDSGDFSRLPRDMTLVTEPLQLSFDLSTGLSHEATISTRDSEEDQGISDIDIYPVTPENFSPHEKRRKMYESNPFCSFFL